MGLAASQARLLFLTSRLSDLELRAQTISNSKIRLASESKSASDEYCRALDKQKFRVQTGISKDGATYEDATLNNLVSYTKQSDLDSTNSKYRYITDTAGKLVVSQSQATDMGGTVTKDADGKYVFRMGIDFDTFAKKVGLEKDPKTNEYNKNSEPYKYYSDLFDKLNRNEVTVISNDNANSYEWLESQVDQGSIHLSEFKKEGGSDSTGAFENVSWESGDKSLQEVDDEKNVARAEAEYNRTMADIQAKDKRFDLQLKQIDTEHQATQTIVDSVKKIIEKDIDRNLKMFQA